MVQTIGRKLRWTHKNWLGVQGHGVKGQGHRGIDFASRSNSCSWQCTTNETLRTRTRALDTKHRLVCLRLCANKSWPLSITMQAWWETFKSLEISCTQIFHIWLCMTLTFDPWPWMTNSSSTLQRELPCQIWWRSIESLVRYGSRKNVPIYSCLQV